MLVDSLLAFGFWSFAGVVGCIAMVQRRRRRGFYPSGALVGNAFQQLQMIAQPKVEYVIEEKLDEDVDEDDAGGPDTAQRHLLRQARRIRRGVEVGRITALVGEG